MPCFSFHSNQTQIPVDPPVAVPLFSFFPHLSSTHSPSPLQRVEDRMAPIPPKQRNSIANYFSKLSASSTSSSQPPAAPQPRSSFSPADQPRSKWKTDSNASRKATPASGSSFQTPIVITSSSSSSTASSGRKTTSMALQSSQSTLSKSRSSSIKASQSNAPRKSESFALELFDPPP